MNKFIQFFHYSFSFRPAIYSYKTTVKKNILVQNYSVEKARTNEKKFLLHSINETISWQWSFVAIKKVSKYPKVIKFGYCVSFLNLNFFGICTKNLISLFLIFYKIIKREQYRVRHTLWTAKNMV